MGKAPSFQYYPDDWRADAVSGCSLAARGLWHEMMNMMHGTERYGYLAANRQPIPDATIARYCGCSLEEYHALLAELDSARVPRRTQEGIIFCSRMVKDQKKRDKWRKDKKNQRDKLGSRPPIVREMSTDCPPDLLSSSSSSIQKQKKERARSWPDGFALSETLLAHAIAHGIPDPAKVWQVFENHHRSKGTRFVDWDRAWYTWVAREPQFRRPDKQGPTANAGSGPSDQRKITFCAVCGRPRAYHSRPIENIKRENPSWNPHQFAPEAA